MTQHLMDPQDDRRIRALYARHLAKVSVHAGRKGRIRVQLDVVLEDGRVSMDSTITVSAAESLRHAVDGSEGGA